MVSLWPWKGDDNSPAAFEKTLSSLSSKIGKASSSLDGTRQRGRRWKALWTLYTSFAYLLYLTIAGAVIGWRNWGRLEYTAVSSAPVSIYLVRILLGSYYDYRTNKQQTYLQSLQKQRDETISKLKEATKYNTTQQLLDKYGATPQKPKQTVKKEKDSSASGGQRAQQSQRTTGFAPPPTANIQHRPSNQAMPDNSQPGLSPTLVSTPPSAPRANTVTQRNGHGSVDPMHVPTGAEFAPNAFQEPRLYAPAAGGPKWYDRLMDVVLGEDEYSPKNRLALICQECRLVNGQAPPGVKTLEEVGRWRCSACGAMNGVESEAKEIIRSLGGQLDSVPSSPHVEEKVSTGLLSSDKDREENEEDDDDDYDDDKHDHISADEGPGETEESSRTTRSMKKGRNRNSRAHC